MVRPGVIYNCYQSILESTHHNQNYILSLLDRRWLLQTPDTKIQRISLSKLKNQESGEPWVYSNNTNPSLNYDKMGKIRQNPFFYVVRDDLLHPLVNGNKARKLDGLLPLLEDHFVTDVVTCGGCQSAHAAAVAVSCAERGLQSHLLLRGEQLEISTGYNLISTMYGNTLYVPRSIYAKREEMLMNHASIVAGRTGSIIQLNDILKSSTSSHSSIENHKGKTRKQEKRVTIINEGAGDTIALLGVIRLVKYLSQRHLFGKDTPLKVIVDAGTGTTAIGLGIGVSCLNLPWEIIAVALVDSIEEYKRKEQSLLSSLKELFDVKQNECALNVSGGLVQWVDRIHPRKFGNVLKEKLKCAKKLLGKLASSWILSTH